MGAGSSVDSSKLIHLEIDGRKEKVSLLNIFNLKNKQTNRKKKTKTKKKKKERYLFLQSEIGLLFLFFFFFLLKPVRFFVSSRFVSRHPERV